MQSLFHHGPTLAETRFPMFYTHWRGVDERTAQAELVASLSRFFCCVEQCPGTWHDRLSDDKKRVRGDILCIPDPSTLWQLGKFVVEVKAPAKRSHKGVGDHIKQAIDYRDTDWHGHGRLPVFLFPGLRTPEGGCCDHGWFVARRVLGSLGLGEIFMERQTGKLAMFLTGHALVWNDGLTNYGQTRSKAGMGIASAST